jgi:hypothetical protein
MRNSRPNKVNDIAPTPVIQSFRQGDYKNLKEFWHNALDETYWTHGITVNVGNGFNVGKDYCRQRLNYIRHRLAREMFGNNWRAKASISFLVFAHGSVKSYNQHFHALLHIEGEHDWSGGEITLAIRRLEAIRPKKHWEKQAYVDWVAQPIYKWRGQKALNRFHSYVARYVAAGNGDWFIDEG